MHVGRLTALGADRLLHLRPRCIEDVAHHHAGAFLREEPRFGRPLAPGPATNQCDFALQSAHGSLPSATRCTTRAIPLPIRCQGSTIAHPVNPAPLWPKAARDSSARRASCRCRRDPWRHAGPGHSVPRKNGSPLRHAPPGLPAFFWQPYAVYIRPSGLANSHTVVCTPQRPRVGGR